MKRLFWIAAVLLCGCDRSGCTVKGHIDGLEGTVYLATSENRLLDSAVVDNGSFRLGGDVGQPAAGRITDNKTFDVALILEPGTVRLENDPDMPERILVSGTPANEAASEFARRQTELIGEFFDPDTSEERRDSVSLEYEALFRLAYENNRDNYFGVQMLEAQTAQLSPQEMLDEIALFSPAMQATGLLTDLRREAERKLEKQRR
ncbi:MAG: DUF4369 domain-containing protein [Alistipes sp.]|nr:DUF4369 domain-containing protein [Alistipes senegalensis]MCM1249735.1 DUF4369 domain-containing protein [Alistipes sp.]